MHIEVLDPTHESSAGAFERASRLATLEHATVGLISNGKEGTKPFFDAFERVLRTRHGVGNVVRTVKSNYSAPADDVILEQAGAWDALIAGIGD